MPKIIKLLALTILFGQKIQNFIGAIIIARKAKKFLTNLLMTLLFSSVTTVKQRMIMKDLKFQVTTMLLKLFMKDQKWYFNANFVAGHIYQNIVLVYISIVFIKESKGFLVSTVTKLMRKSTT